MMTRIARTATTEVLSILEIFQDKECELSNGYYDDEDDDYFDDELDISDEVVIVHTKG